MDLLSLWSLGPSTVVCGSALALQARKLSRKGKMSKELSSWVFMAASLHSHY